MATSDRVSIQLYVDDQGSVQIRSVKKELEELGNAGASSGSKIAEGMDAASSSFSAVAVGAAAASAAIIAGFKAGISAIEEFNLKIISIGVGLTNIAKEGQGSFESMLKQNMAFSVAMYEKMREEDAKRFASLDDLMTGYNTLVQKGYAVRIEEVSALGVLVDKIKLATAGQNTQFQVMQEMRGLLDGQVRAGSLLASEVRDRIGPEWEKILDKHRQAGTLLEWLASLWPGIAAAAKEVENTLEAQTTTLYGNLKSVGREGLTGAYQDLVDLIKEWNAYLRENFIINDSLIKSYNNVRGAVKGAFNPADLEMFFRAIEKISRALGYVATLFGAIGASVKGGMEEGRKVIEEFQNSLALADWNVKAQRYEKQGVLWGRYGTEGTESLDQTIPKGQRPFSGGMYEGMNKAFMERFIAMNEEFKKLTGRDIKVTDAFRTFADQVKVYKEKGPSYAATPGTSPHEKGRAMDISTEDARILAEKGLFGLYGFDRPLLHGSATKKPEPWHIEMIDYAKQERDAAKAGRLADSQAAREAKALETAQKKIENLSDTLDKETARSTGSSMDQITEWANHYLKEIDRVGISEEEKVKAREKLEQAKQAKIGKLEDEFNKWKANQNKNESATLDEQHAEALKKYRGLKGAEQSIDETFSRKKQELAIGYENEKLGLIEQNLSRLSSLSMPLQDQIILQKTLIGLEDKRNANALELLVLQGKISKEEAARLRDVQRLYAREQMRQADERGGGFFGGLQAGARDRSRRGEMYGYESGRGALDAGERMMVGAMKDISSKLTKALFHPGEEKFDFGEFAAQLGEMIVSTLLNTLVETLVNQFITVIAQLLTVGATMTTAGIGLTGAATALGTAAVGLNTAAIALQAVAIKQSIPIIGHTGMIVAHGGHNLASDERFVKAQVGEWILSKQAVGILLSKGIGFRDLNSGRLSANAISTGGTVINHSYAPIITHRMTQADYNQDAKKLYRAHDRERKRRGIHG